ncbi:lipopolysaccharide biosynthesis protein [Psychromonas sp. KJ10-10]|uniref:lipopolysaccharide biosynthesis protein n=1 Tax=Psychromonas sp. KJ10-10 TaxID=3391823 RepID=UPI0039B57B78
MKLLKNSVLQQSLLYGMSIALMKGISLLILPFIAHQLSNEEFGRLEVISTLAIIGSILVGMGLEDTLFRFAGSVKTKAQQNHITAQIFGLSLIVTVLALFAGWYSASTIATWIPGSPSIYEVRLVVSVLALEGCIAIPLGWLRMNDRAVNFFIASCGRALLQATLVLILLHFERGVAGILEAGLIATVAQTLLLGYWQLRGTGISYNSQIGKRALIYSLPIVGSDLLAFTLNGLDRWILASHTSLDDVAQFSIATKFALATVLLLQPFGMWWSPKRFTVLHETNGEAKVARFVAMGIGLALMISLWVAILAPILITQLLPASYNNARQYALGLIAIMLLKELVELINIGCFIGKTTRSQFVINLIVALIGVSAMLVLTPTYQVWGIIFALLLAQSIRLWLFYQVSQYFLPLNYPLKSLMMLTLVGLFWLFISLQLSHILHLLLVLICATLSLLFCAQALNLIKLPFTFMQWSLINE